MRLTELKLRRLAILTEARVAAEPDPISAAWVVVSYFLLRRD
jgi:hypothetical protein